MKKINVKCEVINEIEGKVRTCTTGLYDEINKTVSYEDNGVLVFIKIGKEIVIERKNNEYKFILIFDINKETTTKYSVNEPKIEIELVVKTHKIEIKEDKIHIKYKLKMNKENVGDFVIDIRWEEQV